ncbi:hypothetical protein KIN20_027312 [Parelaphostrongylus tenuis]|uniref:Uncharacterized protein n=1 Tax=Parelaphostrongylus tenuis TaxID=148309 RepID=A0AAD5QZA8_PARTN|nr:hypothetical protein KIN20_027312 [Parelaphostrongylus tenuis]
MIENSAFLPDSFLDRFCQEHNVKTTKDAANQEYEPKVFGIAFSTNQHQKICYGASWK